MPGAALARCFIAWGATKKRQMEMVQMQMVQVKRRRAGTSL